VSPVRLDDFHSDGEGNGQRKALEETGSRSLTTGAWGRLESAFSQQTKRFGSWSTRRPRSMIASQRIKLVFGCLFIRPGVIV
jgi:hypothetical protein